MMSTENILIGILGGGNLLLFIKFLIERHDAKKEKGKDNIKDKLNTLEKDVIRTQLLVMILWKPQEKKEILTLGQHYFETLKGNWYMTDIFDKWLEEECDSKPEWFKKED